MRVHRTSWIAFWLAGLAMFSASDQARCDVPRGHFTDVTNVGSAVNRYGPIAPSISADGLTLYFGSGREGNRDLYQATRPSVIDAFGDVVNLGLGINGPATDRAPAVSSDGLTLYFSSTRAGGLGSDDIYQASRPTVDDPFGDVMNLGTINTRYDDRPEHISPDGKTLWFESTRPGGEGGFDLYMATRENLSEPFANATNLGSGINGPTDDFGASVSSDGLTMFFGERGGPFRPAGQGAEDIWVAVRTSTDEQFTDVVNLNDFSLGSDVNSRFPDQVPSISHDWPAFGSQLYFNFNRANSYEIWQATWVGPDPMLQAGDADQNLSFDQLDLVQVQVAAKYLTGQTATWGEGDWNGAPGGSVESPPDGDGIFNQLDIVAAQQAATYLAGPYGATVPNGQQADGQTSIVYNPVTGELAVDAFAGLELTSINIDSAAGIFTGKAAANLGGSFDNDGDGNIFKATFGGSFGSLSFGNVVQAGLSEPFLLGDLTVVGSLAGGGDLGNVDLVYVPEPTSSLLLASGLLMGLLYIRRTNERRVKNPAPSDD